MGVGNVGGLLVMLGSILGILYLGTLFGGLPNTKEETQDILKYAFLVVFLLGTGLILIYSDFEYFANIVSKGHIWVIYLLWAFLGLNSILIFTLYRRLKRFEQEERLERLAEKMGEKLGESMIKGLKAKES